MKCSACRDCVSRNIDVTDMAAERSRGFAMFEWTYRGVNSSIPGNRGIECVTFLSPTAKLIESVIILSCGAVLVLWGFNNISTPHAEFSFKNERRGKNFLLVLTTLVWGIEIGFKLASESVIYLLNPCHVTTAMQIYLLAAPPSRTLTAMFRIHLNFLNGAILAILFPVTETRVLPFETTTYWIQHIMMLVVPYYLLQLGGAYNLEKFTDMSWWAMSYGSNIFYHYIILQGIAIPTQVNLNQMLCPATRDPFYGPYYRCLGVSHQALLSPLTNKFYNFVNHFSPARADTRKVIVDGLKGGGDPLFGVSPVTVGNGHHGHRD